MAIGRTKDRPLSLSTLTNPDVLVRTSAGRFPFFPVDAILVGQNWAIYHTVQRLGPRVREFSRDWTVGHVPTGLAAWEHIKHRSVAKRAAELANEVVPDIEDELEVGEKLTKIGWREMTRRVTRLRYGTAADALDIIEEFQKKAKRKGRKKAKRRAKTKTKAKKRRATKRADLDLIRLAERARRAMAKNPDLIQRSLFEANPSFLMPRNVFPEFVSGQIGMVSVYRYRGWEIQIRRIKPHFWAFEVLPGPGAADTGQIQESASTTQEGAVCAARILVDYQEALRALGTDERRYLHGIWHDLYQVAYPKLQFARRSPRFDRPPDLAMVARGIELKKQQARSFGTEFGKETYEWWDNLPLEDRVGLIDDRLKLLYCVHGTDRRFWP